MGVFESDRTLNLGLRYHLLSPLPCQGASLGKASLCELQAVKLVQKKIKGERLLSFDFFGAGDRTRTCTGEPLVPKTSASAIPPRPRESSANAELYLSFNQLLAFA